MLVIVKLNVIEVWKLVLANYKKANYLEIQPIKFEFWVFGFGAIVLDVKVCHVSAVGGSVVIQPNLCDLLCDNENKMSNKQDNRKEQVQVQI